MSEPRQDWISILKAAVDLDWPYFGRGQNSIRVDLPPTSQSLPAAVLVSVAFSGACEKDPHLLLTLRSQSVESHKGQISFPGGVLETGESAEQAALRESEEELGILPGQVRILGRLPELPTLTSGFRVTPILAVLNGRPSMLDLRLHAAEVDRVFWVPLQELLRPEARKMEKYRQGSVDYPTPVFYWEEYRIWGATAAMIWNLTERIEKVNGLRGNQAP